MLATYPLAHARRVTGWYVTGDRTNLAHAAGVDAARERAERLGWLRVERVTACRPDLPGGWRREIVRVEPTEAGRAAVAQHAYDPGEVDPAVLFPDCAPCRVCHDVARVEQHFT
jgi:hypothetical protein